MSASRRLQRSVRVSVAVGLLALAAVVVAAAVVSSTWVSAAAVFSLLAGVTSSRIVYTEVTQTRRDNAIERAELARNFGHAMTKTHDEHQAFTTTMSTRLAAKDKTIVELNGTIRLAEMRADEAEIRVKREAKRANEAQERLSVLLDEVLTSQTEALQGVGIPEAADLPTIVDLLAWEDRASEAFLDGLEDMRHQA
jgi:protein phosphatase 1 regulatory subunit 37